LAIIIVGFTLSAFSFKKGDLKLIESTSESWHSGINGGGSGTEYYFKIKIITDKKLVFDSVWVNNKCLASFLSSNNNTITQNPILFSKNDIVSLRVSDLSLSKTPSSVAPIKYKGDALLRYYLNGKIKYLIIKKIVPKQSINRP
jgi:hypothetical protein